MKIDAESLNGKIMEGGIWKVNVGRNRTEEGGSSWAADGSFHQPASFRPVVFGSAAPLVLNGGFEQVSEMKELPVQKWVSGNTPVLFPVGWSLHGNSVGTLTIRKDDVHSEKQACQVEKGWITSYFDAKTGDTLHIDFWAKGEGLTLMLFRSAGGGS